MGCTPSPFPYTICPASTEMDSELLEDDERKLIHFPVRWSHKKKKEPIVSTVTRTSIATALITSSTVGLCAQLVNVTGPCRIHRGFRMEDPIVLSFDDEMDSIDSILSPSKTFRYRSHSVFCLFLSLNFSRRIKRPSIIRHYPILFHFLFGWRFVPTDRIIWIASKRPLNPFKDRSRSIGYTPVGLVYSRPIRRSDRRHRRNSRTKPTDNDWVFTICSAWSWPWKSASNTSRSSRRSSWRSPARRWITSRSVPRRSSFKSARRHLSLLMFASVLDDERQCVKFYYLLGDIFWQILYVDKGQNVFENATLYE